MLYLRIQGFCIHWKNLYVQSPHNNVWYEATTLVMLSMVLLSPAFVLPEMLVSFLTASVLSLGIIREKKQSNDFFFFLTKRIVLGRMKCSIVGTDQNLISDDLGQSNSCLFLTVWCWGSLSLLAHFPVYGMEIIITSTSQDSYEDSAR